MNHNQRVLNRLNDPNTPREEYMRLWEQWNDIMFRQRCVDQAAANRHPVQLKVEEKKQ